MNGKKSKLLRKIAKLTGRTPRYIKNSYHRMSHIEQEAYFDFVREHISKIKKIESGEI